MYEIIDHSNYIIFRFLVRDSDRNINYVLSDKNSNQCIIFDPLDKDGIEIILTENNLVPKYIFNTHAHPDHIKFNDFFLKKYNCKLLAHIDCRELFEFKFNDVFENDLIKLGNLNLKVLHTPGHCHEHVSLIIDNYLFCGDSIFNCGVGNVLFRGDISLHFRTITHKIKNFPDEYLLMPGHDYLYKNILFIESLLNDTLNDELALLKKNNNEDSLSPLLDMGFEKRNNPFLKIDEFSYLDHLKKKDLFKDEQIEFRFKLLRQLRDEY